MRIADSQLTQFMSSVEQRYNLTLYSYFDLYQWSIDKPAQFWSAVWSFCDIQASQPFDEALEDGDKFPGARRIEPIGIPAATSKGIVSGIR